MEDKSLQDKAIDFKGKKYVLVADRVLYFNENFKEGCITSDLVSDPNADMVVIKATIYPEGINGRYFTGYSQATWDDGYINKTSAIENCETSAIGRALGFMGIGVIESIASVDEINKAQTHPGKKPRTPVMSPQEALQKAEQALMESDTAESLSKLLGQVTTSKNLLDGDKEKLVSEIQKKMDTTNPLE
jgi:hypothetical protein